MLAEDLALDNFYNIHNIVDKHFKKEMFTIHNFLWQIIVNRVDSDKEMTLYNVIQGGTHFLVKVYENQSGYINTFVEFCEHITEKEANKICYWLNSQLFNQNSLDSDLIIMSSFV